MNKTSVEITAGLGGFLVLFCLCLAVWVLGRDMTKRLRRMRLAEEARLRAQAQAEGHAPRPVDTQAAIARAQAATPVQEHASRAPRTTDEGEPDPIG